MYLYYFFFLFPGLTHTTAYNTIFWVVKKITPPEYLPPFLNWDIRLERHAPNFIFQKFKKLPRP